jgi:multiple sugar transport system ATP-binding protein
VLQQVGSPHDLYDNPVNLFVAGFIGSPPMNFVPGRIQGGHIETPFGDLAAEGERFERIGDRDLVIIGIRPEHITEALLVPIERRGHGLTFNAEVDVTEWLGHELFAYIPYEAPHEVANRLKELQRELDSEQMRTQLVVSLDPSSPVESGRKAELWFDIERVHVFDPQTEENLTRST